MEQTNFILAVGAIAQAFFTAVIMLVTLNYARSTRRLVEMQIQPELRLEIQEELSENSERVTGTIRNYTGCDLSSVELRVSLPQLFATDGRVVMQCVDVLSWHQGMRQGKRVVLECYKYFANAVTAVQSKNLSPRLSSLQSTVVFDVSCRRKADNRPFYFSEHYQLRPEVDGPWKIICIHHGASETGDHKILRPTGVVVIDEEGTGPDEDVAVILKDRGIGAKPRDTRDDPT